MARQRTDLRGGLGGAREVFEAGHFGARDQARRFAVDGKQEARIKRQLRQYYQEIIRGIQDANNILIFGPGEAKTELKKELEKSREFALKKITVEPSDKMTERQIAAKVRQFFADGR